MAFLTPEEFNNRAAQWVEALSVDVNATPSLDAAALLVIDMQNDFVHQDGLLALDVGPAVIPNVLKVVNAFRSAGRPVLFTRDIYENPAVDGGLTARWWKLDADNMTLREGTWHAALHEAMQPRPDERVLVKRRYSAFFGTDLEVVLRTAGVKNVVIVGVATNVCCESTAHDAFFRDFQPYVVLDANGGTDETAHLGALRNLQIAYARIVTTDQVVGALRAPRQAA